MSSKRRIRAKSCTGKKQYKTVEEAEPDKRALQFKDRTIFNIYKCTFCGNYHIGHAGSRRVRQYMKNKRAA